MRVVLNTNVNFQRSLRPEEKADFSAVLKQGKEKVGNTGHSMLIVPSISLPGGTNYGVGNMLSKEGQDFIEFAKQYWGVNFLQLLPDGKYKFEADKCLPYSGSSLDLGAHLIDMELLTKNEYAKILSSEDIRSLANLSKPALQDGFVLYEKIIPPKSGGQKVLKKAYDELLKADTPEKKQLLKQIKDFSLENKEWLEPKAIFEALSAKYDSSNIEKWNEIDRNLYNEKLVPVSKRKSVIDGIYKSELKNEIGFFEFKQFLANEHLAKAKRELNQRGIKLGGDVVVGFSTDEVWANPKAFREGCSLSWGLPVMDFDSPEAEKLLRKKINLNAKRYDGLRIDASWSYVRQPIENNFTKEKSFKEYGSKYLEIIEDEILKVKGKGFNQDNIMHEFAANPKDFNLFDGIEIKPLGRERIKIYSSFDLSEDWGTVSAFRKRGWKEGSYILGVSTHDSCPLKVEYENIANRTKQVRVLADILKMPENKIKSYSEFVQAKFAEPMRAKHNMLFFTEALNLEGQYKGNKGHPEIDYRIKIPNNYQEKYFKALEKGEGFNIMDALEKAFVAEGLDKKEPKLYKKIVKYRKVLQEPEKGLNRRVKIIYSLLAISGLAILAVVLQKTVTNKKAE